MENLGGQMNIQEIIICLAWLPLAIYLSIQIKSDIREGRMGFIVFFPSAFFSGIISSLPLEIIYFFMGASPNTFLVISAGLLLITIYFRKKLKFIFEKIME